MSSKLDSETLKMVVPKGRLQEKVLALLSSIGVDLIFSARSYRPLCSDPDIAIKLLKPQNISPLLALGRHDCGFSGHDWIIENGLEGSPDLHKRLDLAYNRVRLVAAVPEDLTHNNQWQSMRLVVASEYTEIARQYIERKQLNAVLIKSHGATEALPPEDADMIIDNTSTGSTLVANRLAIVDEIMQSTTWFITSTAAENNPWKKEKLDQLQMLMQSTLNANQKVMLEMNVAEDDFQSLLTHLPAMRSPTVSPLYNQAGYAIKIAVPSKEAPRLIPQLIAKGARDLVEYKLEKLIP